MNWTGGHLQRHSTANGDVATRQKQYFAKIQQNLRIRSKKKSPLKWSILNHVVEDRDPSHKELSTIKSQYQNRRHSKPQRSSLQLTLNIPPHHETRPFPETNEQMESFAALFKHRMSPKQDGDLYNVTPPPHKQETSALQNEIEKSQRLSNTMSEKRRKLLQRGDWVEVNTHRPVGARFVASMIEDNIGRRRTVVDGRRARYQSRQSNITSPFAHRRRPSCIPRREDSHARGQKNDVRIVIGGKVIPPGLSSSSVAARVRSRSVTGSSGSLNQFSDTMLLEGGDAQKTYASEMRGEDDIDHPWNASRSSHTPLGHYERGILVDQQKDVVGALQTRAKSPKAPRVYYKSVGYAADDSQRHEILDTHATSPNDETDLKQDVRENERFFVVSSQPSSIYHPVPQSSKVSSLLCLDSLDTDGTNIANVGVSEQTGRGFYSVEDEIWATWTIPPSDEEEGRQESDSHNNDHTAKRTSSISPGISIIIANGRMEKRRAHEESRSSPLQTPDHTEVPRLGNQRSVMEGFVDQQRHTATVSPPLRILTPIKDSIAGKAVDQEVQDDLDQIWRRFIFGGDSDEVEHTGPKPALETIGCAHTLENISIIGTRDTVTPPDSPRYGCTSEAALPALTWSSDLSSSDISPNVDSISIIAQPTSLTPGDRGSVASLQQVDEGETITLFTHTSNGSSMEVGIGTSSASIIVQASSSPSEIDRNESSISVPPRKVIFTKPAPFTGTTASRAKIERPLHIGRTFMDTLDIGGLKRRKRKQRHDTH